MDIRSILWQSARLKQQLCDDENLVASIARVIKAAVQCYRQGGKTLFCGNGGSAADAQHLAAELSGRFYFDRPPLDAEALHVNTSYLTAVANDYGYDEVFARLVQAKGRRGDLLFAFSTSGSSPNIVRALQAARQAGMITVGFTGSRPCAMDALCDHIFRMPSDLTPRVQEMHILLGHIICQGIEEALYSS